MQNKRKMFLNIDKDEEIDSSLIFRLHHSHIT